uniref:DUF4774 domain-containing protein n=1 Tax=Glossina brevipalpis TaxID=37001 RepID=A0A1A9W7H5_9MUSC
MRSTTPPPKTIQNNISETKRILDEIEKINQALGYFKKTGPSKVPILLDSSEYLFPNGQNSPIKTTNGETLLFPTIRTVKSQIVHNRANQYNEISQREVLETSVKTKTNGLAKEHSQIPIKALIKSQAPPFIYFEPYHLELQQAQQSIQTPKVHFVIPVKLYKQNSRQEFLERLSPMDYQFKGYKIVGDFQNFYNKSNGIKQPAVSVKTKPSAKYHLLLVPQTLLMQPQARTVNKDIKIIEDENDLSTNSGRGEKVKKSSHKIQAPVNNTQILAKRTDLKSQNIEPNSINNLTKVSMITPFMTTTISTIQQQKLYKTPYANNTGPNAVKTAFQHIFKFPFRPESRPQQQQQQQQVYNTESSIQGVVPLKIPQKLQYTALAVANPLVGQSLNQHKPSDLHFTDYKWEDESMSGDNESSVSNLNEDDESHEKSEKTFLAHHQHHHAQKHEVQKEALKQAGIIIQKLKVRKGGIAIAGPGGVATAGSGGTAIVGPGGYALTHPRGLTIAGPGARVIAIPSHVDLKDALRRTNLVNQTWPREGRIVATGPTVYYAPPTAIDVEF